MTQSDESSKMLTLGLLHSIRMVFLGLKSGFDLIGREKAGLEGFPNKHLMLSLITLNVFADKSKQVTKYHQGSFGSL